MDANGCKPNKSLCFEDDEKTIDEEIAKLENGDRIIESLNTLPDEYRVKSKSTVLATAEMFRKRETVKIDADEVTRAFNSFLNTYESFREQHNLSGSIDNVYEILAALTDKLGRICRYVKHQERNDPKPDWPEGMTSEIAGLLIYLIILKNHYDADISKGMKFELDKAIEQHSKKEIDEST